MALDTDTRKKYLVELFDNTNRIDTLSPLKRPISYVFVVLASFVNISRRFQFLPPSLLTNIPQEPYLVLYEELAVSAYSTVKTGLLIFDMSRTGLVK